MKNNHETGILCCLAVLAISVFSACTNNSVTMLYSVEFLGKDVLVTFADVNANDSDFVKVLDKSLAIKAQFPDDPLIDVFYKTWEKELPDKPMAEVFYNYCTRDFIYSDNISNYTVYEILRRECLAAYHYVAMHIAYRLERYGCRFVTGQSGLLYDTERFGEVVHYRLKNVKDTAIARQLIIAEGNINIWETYQLEEIGADFLDSEPEVQQSIQEYGQLASSILGWVKNEDCESIVNLLNKVEKEKLPSNLIFTSGKLEPAKNGLIPIFMLKSNHGGQSCMDGGTMIDAKTMIRKGQGGQKYYALAITLNSNGAKIFQHITGENVNRELAITVDGEVCCAPRVIGQIANGRLEIGGSFSKEEAGILEILIKSGKLMANCIVTNVCELSDEKIISSVCKTITNYLFRIPKNYGVRNKLCS
jgi:hypothetical protein